MLGKTFQSMTSWSSPKDSAAVNSTIFSECKQTLQNQIRNLSQHCQAVQINSHKPDFTFLADSRFSEWLGNSSSVRLGCLSEAGAGSVFVSASTVESLCTDDSSVK